MRGFSWRWLSLLLSSACTRGEPLETWLECEEQGWADADGDGYGDPTTPDCGPKAVDSQGDCDDRLVSVYPGARELCNGLDDDCDGLIDEPPADPGTVYLDRDGDLHGDPSIAMSSDTCTVPAGYAETGDDCDDDDSNRSPSAAELCDGVDNRCNQKWTIAEEDGHVTHVDEFGYLFDVTIPFSEGTPGAPFQIEIPGGTLLVCPGTYYVGLTIIGPTVLTGRGLDSTVLDGAGGRIIEASADLSLSNLSLVGGDAYGGDGGAIYQRNGALSIDSAELRNNRAVYGGAIASLSDENTLASVDLRQVSMLENHAERGGALYADIDGPITLAGAYFENNDASGDGGALAIDGATDVALDYNTFYSNISVGNGGGLYVNILGPIRQSSDNLYGNASTVSGGGAFLASPSTITIEGLSVSSNAAGAAGGGMALSGETLVTVTSSLFLENSSPTDGAGLYLVAADALLTEVSLEENNATATGAGGGLFAQVSSQLSVFGGSSSNNTAYIGGGVSMFGSDDDVSVVIDGMSIEGNTSLTSGGGMLLGDVLLDTFDTSISSNEALFGGAVHLLRGTASFQSGSRLNDNLVPSFGAAIYIDSGVVFCGGADLAASIVRNEGDIGSAAYLAGDEAIFIASSCDVGTGYDENMANDGSDIYISAIPLGYDFAGSLSTTCTSAGCE